MSSVIRKSESPSRRMIQIAFAVGVILTAIQFHRFVVSISQTAPEVQALRPAAVDAWLPISSFMSLVYLVKTGIANTVHPAGLVLFTLILLLAFSLRRGFCSWVCPIGTLSEYAHLAGRYLFKRNAHMPKPLDIVLRSIKYLLLALFVVLICRMTAEDLRAFIYGPYNRICDVKMYAMFASPSLTTLTVVTVLGILSLVFKNFWCRYLCPYGALLGLASMPSPTAVRRDPARCTGCGVCTAACPNNIRVHRVTAVRSPECTACYGCVSACPQAGALRMGLPRPKKAMSLSLYGLITLAAFVFVPQAFRAFGYWDTDTPYDLYRRLVADLAAIGHPRTSGRLSGPE
ncbi:MAG TPA: 4Fe-4S binding protein [Kiritimatiellia bacterium]|nr:4Fe-4S binding protein [Kiritimatiellia bacterium]HRU69740.1 4Fe-4S binding protein [Kiritimatiellia bacterium]